MFLFFGRGKEEPIPAFIASIEERENLLIVRLRGEIGAVILNEALKFKKRIQDRPDFRYRNTLYDFREVTGIDSAAVAQLISLLSELKRSNHRLGVINLKEGFREEIRLLKVEKLIVEYPTEADAVRDLDRPIP